MVDSISASAASIQRPPPPPANQLTDEQSTDLEALLSEYDAENLTDEQAQELVTQIQELGIEPGRSLGQALDANGLSPRGLAEQAGISADQGGQAGPPPPQSTDGGVSSGGAQALQAISDFLETSENNTLTEDDWESLLASLEANGVDTAKPLIDFRV